MSNRRGGSAWAGIKTKTIIRSYSSYPDRRLPGDDRTLYLDAADSI